MTIQRIRTTEGLKDVHGVKVLPVAVIHNGVVNTCGVMADPTGDVKAQTKEVLGKIDWLLEKAGADKSKLLTANVWLADMQDIEEHNSVWNGGWTDKILRPVFASRLPLWRPNILVEIMVTAAQ